MSGGISGGICTSSYSKSDGKRNIYLLYLSKELHEGNLTGGFMAARK